MKYISLVLTMLFLLASCKKNIGNNGIYVENATELKNAIEQSKPGDNIILSNGIWKNTGITFYGHGTKDKPISIIAETPGKVFLEGNSYLHLGGEHLHVGGLYFRNGYSPNSSIIRFMINEDSVANYCRVTNTVLKDFNQPNRYTNDRWIEFYGKHNSFDHNFVSGKSNDGETLRVFFTGNQ
ncbi:MAG TPA: alginate lyase, partial [Maribacter sp.]|nr:alginate lyase [Maribacter sp.]